jgi:hypothetical protein
MSNTRRSRMSKVVVLPIAAALTLTGLTACGEDKPENPDYGAYCVDEDSGERVKDDRCGDPGDDYHDSNSSDALLWYFIGRSQVMPAVGQPSPVYATRTLPRNAVIGRGFSSKGGTVTRGGFGTSGAKGVVGTGSKAGSVGGGGVFGGSVGG